MAGLLEDVEISDEQRQAHDKNDFRVVIVVLAVFLLFAYLFTHLPARLGLPTPRECILRFHLLHRYIGQLVSFSPDGSFNTALNAQATDLVSVEIALILGL